jgi:methionyl-tRNA formyltransferase
MPMRIVFMGTPDFAEVSLKKLIEDGREVVGVSRSRTAPAAAAWRCRPRR